jgi:CRP-like cAMP-binding protein
MAVSIEHILHFSLLKGLELEDIKKIAQHTDFQLFEDKETVLKYGAFPIGLYFLESGQLQISDHAEDSRVIGMHIMNPGAHFGTQYLIDAQTSNNMIRATERSGIFIWSISHVRKFMNEQPNFLQIIIKDLTLQIRKLHHQKALLSIPNSYHRVFLHVHFLTDGIKNGQKIANLPNQKDIASAVNTSRETVSRALQILIKNEVLLKNGHQLMIRNPQLLAKLAADGLDALIP